MPDAVQHVVFSVHGQTALVTLNRPERRNAIDAEMADQLLKAIERLEDDPSLRVGVLIGAGSAFCSGMDLGAFLGPDRDRLLRKIKAFSGLSGASRTKPLIAAVHGAALAGGFEIALACDIVVAARGTKFGLPEVLRGLVAAAGGAFRLGQRIPAGTARKLLLTGDSFDAADAMNWGLVSDVVDEDQLCDFALSLAKRIAANPAFAVQASLKLANAATSANEQSLWALNEGLWPQIADSEDAREGSRAFVEKRKPVWN